MSQHNLVLELRTPVVDYDEDMQDRDIGLVIEDDVEQPKHIGLRKRLWKLCFKSNMLLETWERKPCCVTQHKPDILIRQS